VEVKDEEVGVVVEVDEEGHHLEVLHLLVLFR
jgi:hypothetical protein